MSRPQGGNGSGFGPSLTSYPSHGKSYAHSHGSHGSESHRKYSGDHYKRHYHHSRYDFKDNRPRKRYKDERDDYHYPSSGSEACGRGHEGQIDLPGSYTSKHISDYDRDRDSNKYSHSRSRSGSIKEAMPTLRPCASVPVPVPMLQHNISISSTMGASPTSAALYAPVPVPTPVITMVPVAKQPEIEVVRKEEAMEIDMPIPVSKPEEKPAKAAATVLERLEEVKRELERPRKSVAEDWTEPAPMRQTFLSSSVSLKLAGQVGRTLHGEHWKLDPKWMKEEIVQLLAADKQRLETEWKERLEKISAGANKPAATDPSTAEMKDDIAKPPPHLIVPRVHYNSKGLEQALIELKIKCRRCKEKEAERQKAEFEVAKHTRLLAESKMQFLCSELKTKLLDLRLSNNNMRSSS